MDRDRLTATEARVAGLTASGRSDAEIAAALQLSAPSVEDHLLRIYRKLGLRSRSELALLVGGASSSPARPGGGND